MPSLPDPELGIRLESLLDAVDVAERVANDPVRFVKPFEGVDAEIAGAFAAGLAFGRVSLFAPVVAGVLEQAKRHGGPRAWLSELTERPANLSGLCYRWIREPDLALFAETLAQVLVRYPDLETLFLEGYVPSKRVRKGLCHMVGVMQRLARETPSARALGLSRSGAFSRGFQYFLTSPDGGSPCKRWNLFLRWMVRLPDDGVDLGIWHRVSSRDLIIPLDTHVFRVSRFLGLTRRAAPSWKAAREVTDALRHFHPTDPVRYDFALAHLGISQGCRGERVSSICGTCPLDPVCQA